MASVRQRVLTSRAATRGAFIVIIAFVTAQMAWWIYFQQRYVSEVSRDTVAGLTREADSLNRLLMLGAGEAVSELLVERPHLRIDAASQRVVVSQASLSEFAARQRSAVRMLAFEGPFFVLVVMAGLFVIGRSLRLERELKRRQRNFLDAIGHEYRTPISTLRLLIETLQLRAPSPAKLREYLRSMSAEVDRLEHTGQQVLSTARLEAGAPMERRTPGDLAELVNHALQRTRSWQEGRGARIECAVCGAVPVLASFDDVAILVENLVDNAVKYSSGPEKRVTVTVRRQDEWAQLSVEDRGPGIPERERALVFERFYRIGNEMTRTAPGLGLGLYLVQRTAESLGGRVVIEEAEAGGVRVVVSLPLDAGVVSAGFAPRLGVIGQ